MRGSISAAARLLDIAFEGGVKSEVGSSVKGREGTGFGGRETAPQ